ncbi:GAP family protein [Actinocorallia populi]|uniref:GAP family protein n=1 Tax=Actinocorallia populi TaxID=2079200 RepID=UPI000D09286C|nr:GAP family protein [Actinocorallia populi]
MSTGLVLSLAGLALVDGTSIGTLFIPVWLLLAPGRVRAGRVLAYLAAITVFYFCVGLLVVLGAGSAADAAGAALDGRAALWVQLAIGIALFAWSFRFDPERAKGTGGVSRWRDRATAESTSTAWLMGLALLAGLVEVATMLPYLGAIGMITTSELGTPWVAALLAGYCLLMVLPATVLLTARVTARSRIEPLLQRMNTWITEKAGGATGWIIAIAGFLVARDAAARLWFPHLMGQGWSG